MEQKYTQFEVEDDYIYASDGIDVTPVPNNGFTDRIDDGDSIKSGHEPVTEALLKTALLGDGKNTQQSGFSIGVEAAVTSLSKYGVIDNGNKVDQKARALIEFLTCDENYSVYSVGDDGNINIITQLDETSQRAEIDNVAALANLSHEIIQNKIKEAKEYQQLIENTLDRSEIDEQISNPQQALDNVVRDLQRFGKDNQTIPEPKVSGTQGKELEAPDEVSPDNRREYVRKLRLAKEYAALVESRDSPLGPIGWEDYSKKLLRHINMIETKLPKIKMHEETLRSHAFVDEIGTDDLMKFANSTEALLKNVLRMDRTTNPSEFLDWVVAAANVDIPDAN